MRPVRLIVKGARSLARSSHVPSGTELPSWLQGRSFSFKATDTSSAVEIKDRLSKGDLPYLDYEHMDTLLDLLQQNSDKPVWQRNMYASGDHVERVVVQFLKEAKKPTITLLTISEILLKDKPCGHAICLYFDPDKGIFYCDNNGEKYRSLHVKSNPQEYSSVKDRVIEIFRHETRGLPVLTNLKPTFDIKDHCTFASMDLAGRLAMSITDPWKILTDIDHLSEKERAETYPTKDLRRLESFLQKLEEAKKAKTSTKPQLR